MVFIRTLDQVTIDQMRHQHALTSPYLRLATNA